jgi:hypothetical protein
MQLPSYADHYDLQRRLSGASVPALTHGPCGRSPRHDLADPCPRRPPVTTAPTSLDAAGTPAQASRSSGRAGMLGPIREPRSRIRARLFSGEPGRISLVRLDYMQTPDIRSQVRPALSHSLFVVYDGGEAPGFDDSWLAHPATRPTRTRAMAMAFMGLPASVAPRRPKLHADARGVIPRAAGTLACARRFVHKVWPIGRRGARRWRLTRE